MRNEFDEHRNANAVGGLIAAGGALLIGALGKKMKEKADEKKKEKEEKVILETRKYKVSEKK